MTGKSVRSAVGRASARIAANAADVLSVGARAFASTSALEANVRIAKGQVSVSTTAEGGVARHVATKQTSRFLLG